MQRCASRPWRLGRYIFGQRGIHLSTAATRSGGLDDENAHDAGVEISGAWDGLLSNWAPMIIQGPLAGYGRRLAEQAVVLSASAISGDRRWSRTTICSG